MARREARREYEDEGFLVGRGGDYRRPLSETEALAEIIVDVQAGRSRTAINKLKILHRLAARGFHKNPPSGDAEIMFGQRVLAVEYIHSQDGHAYRHEFGKGVRLFANPDGTLGLAHVP